MQRDDDNFEWINGKRILKDHGHLRVPMHLRDGRVNPNLTDVQRAVAANRPSIDSSGRRPGFVFVDDAATREARARMYALKDLEYENAWRGYDDRPSNEIAKRTKQMTGHYDNSREDDAFDENGLRRDDHKSGVPLTTRHTMSPMQREIATKRARVTDGNGNFDQFSRPGWRILADGSVNDARNAREAAYQEYEDYITNAWRTKPPRV
jgi:hypothetical protein